MRICKLTPVDPRDPVWKEYDTRPIFVRAESGSKAQDLAQSVRLQFDESRFGEKIELNLWVGYKTRCEDVIGISEYSIDGPSVVVIFVSRC
jgi:hypothetical protein